MTSLSFVFAQTGQSVGTELGFLAYLPKAERVIVIAPVFRNQDLMEVLWKKAKAGNGEVFLIGGGRALVDEKSFFLTFGPVGGRLYLLDPWPLKPEGSFVLADGKKGVIGPWVAGLPDPKERTRELSGDEAMKWWGYGLTLLRVARPYTYVPENALLKELLERLKKDLGGKR